METVALDARALFKDRGALLEGHFRLSSGLHAERYVQCQAIMGEPVAAGQVAVALAERFAAARAEVVCGPATGAIVLAHEVARALGCPSVFAEREGGGFTLRRGQHIEPGARVLVAENVVTTGGSVIEVLQLLESLECEVVGVAALIDRSPQAARPFAELRFEALLRLSVPAFTSEACPACAAGRPITSPGSRYLKRGSE